MGTYFKTETEDHSIGKTLSEKKYGGTRSVSEKMEAFFAQLKSGSSHQ